MAAAPGTTAAALPELTVSTFLGAWRLDGVALAAVVLLGGLYVAGVLRRPPADGRWPAARTTAFLVLGLGAIVVATMSGLAVYGRVLFWPAAVQNIVLDLIAPLGLALGDPLALVTPDGPLHGVLTGRVVRLLTYPLVSSAAVLGSELTIYCTPYFETALRHDAVRQLMHLQLLLTGCLFVLPMLTHQELLPRWCTHPVRAALVFLDGLFDSLPGIVVMTSGTLVAGHWYAAQPRTWGPSPQQDQLIGGGLMLTLAELVGLPFLIAVFAQWWRTDRANTAGLDARLDQELRPAPPPRTPASAAPGPTPAVPEMTRPWWETESGEVGRRMRRRS